jgi:hypothetical protein
MEFLAEVVRVEPRNDGYLVAASILAIDENARDAIVQAVFRKQRREIRDERESEQSGER